MTSIAMVTKGRAGPPKGSISVNWAMFICTGRLLENGLPISTLTLSSMVPFNAMSKEPHAFFRDREIQLSVSRWAHLILGDEAVWLNRLLPLQEDHVIQRGEG